MKKIWISINWFLTLIFTLLAFAMFSMGGSIQGFIIIGIILFLIPPFRNLMHKVTGKSIPLQCRVILIFILWGVMVLTVIMNPVTTIYKSPEVKSKFDKMYDVQLAKWPVPYQSKFIKTSYGKVHIIISGPENGESVLLINASSLSGWSWIFNIKDLSKQYRTYAIDNIGEPGKSLLNNRNLIPSTRKEVSDFYTEISDKLNIKKSYVIGASIGGYISTCYALNRPERIKKLVLLAPMGYGSTMKTIIGITLSQGFPFKFVQDKTFVWAFGDNLKVKKYFSEWFFLVLNGTMPNPIRPTSFAPEHLQKIKVPTLAFFGTQDGVIGSSKDAEILAKNIPNAEIEIVESGHLMGAEIPDKINSRIITFFQQQ